GERRQKSRANGRKRGPPGPPGAPEKRTPFPEPSRHPGWSWPKNRSMSPERGSPPTPRPPTAPPFLPKRFGPRRTLPPSAREPNRREEREDGRNSGRGGFDGCPDQKELRLLRHQRPACRRRSGNPHLRFPSPITAGQGGEAEDPRTNRSQRKRPVPPPASPPDKACTSNRFPTSLFWHN